MLKENINYKTEKGITYFYTNGKRQKYTPWLGNVFSFLYDSIMERSLFPKKFEASIKTHNAFLKNELKDIHKSNILELATGSGNLSNFLNINNNYTGIDISKGLLKIAKKKFAKKNFSNCNLYLCSADSLPFKNNSFNVCICNLSLNFFNNVKTVINEIKRVLKENGRFICSVPVPERNKNNSTIRGQLYSEKELKKMFEEAGFEFCKNNLTNGTLLYFSAKSK